MELLKMVQEIFLEGELDHFKMSHVQAKKWELGCEKMALGKGEEGEGRRKS